MQLTNGVVVDTNVLMHISNTNEDRCEEAKQVVDEINSNSYEIIVDQGFDVDESKNTSVIISEYFENLVPGDYGYRFLLEMAQKSCIKEVSSSVPSHVSKKVNLLIYANKVDRIFLKVSINSPSNILISHDFKDFPAKVRKEIRKEFSVDVCEAKEFLP